MSKVKIAIVIILLALIVIIATSSSKEEYVSLVEEDNAVLVADQQPGDEVTVNYVKLDKPGYVSVYSKGQNGAQELLGTSALLSAGEHRNVSVPLKKRVVSGNTVRIGVVADDGDGEFDQELDLNVLDEDGEEVSFEVVVVDDAPNAEEVDLADLADDAGYDVNEDSDILDDSEEMNDSEEEMTEEDSMSEDSESMEDDSQEEMDDSNEEITEEDPMSDEGESMEENGQEDSQEEESTQ